MINITMVVRTKCLKSTEARMTSPDQGQPWSKKGEIFIESITCELILKVWYAITGGRQKKRNVHRHRGKKDMAGWRNGGWVQLEDKEITEHE